MPARGRPWPSFCPSSTWAARARLELAQLARFPGHADYAFYYTVARNLLDGRGLVVDYIWQFLSNPQGIPNPSTDYWLPGASLIMAPFMLALGQTLKAALVPSILAGLGVAWPIYLWARDYGRSRFVGFCSAALALVVPSLFTYSLLTDTAIYYVFFLTWALYFMSRAWRDPRWFLAAGACGGIAHTIRQDSVLIVPILLLAIALWQPARALRAREGSKASRLGPFLASAKVKLLWAALSLLVYLAVLSPLLIHNMRVLGAPLSPASGKTLWLTTYEDLYSYSRDLRWQTFVAWGWDNIVAIKLDMAGTIARQVWRFLPISLWLMLVLAACLPARKSRQRKWLLEHAGQPLPSRPRMNALALGLMGLIYLFYAFVATFPGLYAVTRSGIIVLPFVMVIIVDALHRTIPWRPVTLAIVVLIGVSLYGSAVDAGRSAIRGNNGVGERLANLAALVEADAASQGLAKEDILIMARDPWEVNLATGHRAIEIPNEDRDTVYEVALRFGATHVLLPGNRWSMDALVRSRDDPRFQYLARVPNGDKSVFRIVR